ncbi:MAG: polysaccharide biosynthesis protein [Clostridia bacterium]|nr:polysaccharide biosynthesis protein [Clostridia bacterium]
MAKTTKSMVGGMTVLGVAGIVCKFIGVLFSIPLTWLIKDSGQGLFQSVYPTYSLLLTISSAGLPVAVSRMVSHALTRDDPRTAKHVFRIALWILAAVGCVLSLAMFMGRNFLARWVNQPESTLGFQAIAPCVALVCVMSAIRGLMQGQQNMVPTAVSQLLEQCGKVAFALPLAYLGMKQDLAHGAAGALLGITCSEALALLYMVIVYFRKRGDFDALPQTCEEPSLTERQVLKELLIISLPITISACIVPLSTFIDSGMLVGRMLAAGLDAKTAQAYYGIQTGLVVRLINIPTALALSISMSLVPAVTAAAAAGSQEGVRQQSDLGMRFAFLVGLPCSVGMSVLSYNIMAFFYEGTLAPERLRLAGELLSMSALTVVLFTVVQATTAILQGVRKQRIPMYTLIAGVAAKIALNYVLVGLPELHIHGGPIASLVCYTVSMVPNIFFVLKYTGMRFNWKGWLLRPGLAAACMGLAAWGLRELLPVSRLATIAEVLVGIAVYLGAAILFKAINPRDFAALRRRKKAKAA